MEAELSELSHGSIRTHEPEYLFILAHVDVGACVLIGSHVTQGNHGDVVCDLLTLDATACWAVTSRVEEEQREADNQEQKEQIGKGFLGHQEQGWTEAYFLGDRCNPL